jgi:hypothetical protein
MSAIIRAKCKFNAAMLGQACPLDLPAPVKTEAEEVQDAIAELRADREADEAIDRLFGAA